MKTLLALLWGLAALFASVPGAGARLSASAAAGYGGICKMGRWNPVTITLADADSEIRGSAVVSMRRGRTNINFMVPVDLSPSSRKRFTLYVPLTEHSSELSVSIMDNGHVAAVAKTPFRTVYEDEFLLVEVTDGAPELAFLTGTPLVPAGSGSWLAPRQIQAGYMQASLLPDKPDGFDGADIVILRNFGAERVQPSVLNALRMWIASGGSLIVCGGPDYAVFTSPFFREILPVEVDGAVQARELDALRARYPYPPGQAGGIFICRSRLKPGARAIISQNGIPLVAAGHYGLGSVVFLAFDLHAVPFGGKWSLERRMWKDLILLAKPLQSIGPARESRKWLQAGASAYGGVEKRESPLGEAALAMRPTTPPSLTLLAVFLILYLFILVPANYYVLRRINRYELAWVTTPAIIILFTFGAWAMGYAIRGGETMLNRIALIETASNARAADVTGYLGLFAAGRGRYDLILDDPYAMIFEILPGSREGYFPHPAAVVQGDAPSLNGINMQMWSTRCAYVHSGVILKGPIEASLTLSGNRLEGRITNRTGMNLYDCSICAGGAVLSLKSLQNGKSALVSVSFGSAPLSGVPALPVPAIGPDSEAKRTIIEYLRGALATNRGPVLVGWTRRSGLSARLQGGAPLGEDLGVVVTHLGYRLGRSYLVPEGLIPGVLVEMSPSVEQYHDASDNHGLLVPRGCYFVEDFAFPMPPAGPPPTSVAIHTKGSFPNPREVRVECFNWSKNHYDLVGRSAGVVKVDPHLYVRPNDGLLRVRFTAGTTSSDVSLDISARGGGI